MGDPPRQSSLVMSWALAPPQYRHLLPIACGLFNQSAQLDFGSPEAIARGFTCSPIDVTHRLGWSRSTAARLTGLSNTITFETNAFMCRVCVRPQALAIAPKSSLR